MKVGIIGLGVGRAHLDALLDHPSSQVIMVADQDTTKLSAVAATHPNLKITSCADELLSDSDIDLVSVCSYDNYHYEHIIKALEYDKHVFVEKPFCLHINEARGIWEKLQSKPKLKLSSNLILRTSPRFQEVYKWVADGRLGEIYYLEGAYNYGRLDKLLDGWRGDISFYSVVYGGGIHIVDLLLWLTGGSVHEVFAYGNRICSKGSKFGFNDCVVAILSFDNGMVGRITANFGCVRPHGHEIGLYGTKATFINSSPADAALYTSRGSEDGSVVISTTFAPPSKGALLRDFIDSIVTGKSPLIDTQEVFRTMAVCFAIEESVKTGQRALVSNIW